MPNFQCVSAGFVVPYLKYPVEAKPLGFACPLRVMVLKVAVGARVWTVGVGGGMMVILCVVHVEDSPPAVVRALKTYVGVLGVPHLFTAV